MFKILFYLFVMSVVVSGQSSGQSRRPRFKVMYEWEYVNFTWPSEEALHTATTSGKYVPENNILSGMKYFDKYLYLTLPRMKEGVPATLARIPEHLSLNATNPLLSPFPSWEMNVEGDCTALQNVQNIEIDPEGQMWILDGGRTGTMTKLPNSKCPPRLIIYDIKQNVTVRNFVFPKEVTGNGSYLYDLVVDDADGGYAYITDNSGVDPGLIVYSMKQNKAWQIRDDNSMRASPDATEFRVNGTALSSPINIAGIALGPHITSGDGDTTIITQDRLVYYCPLSSYHLYSVNSAVLRNERSSMTGIRDYVKDLGRKASQTDGMKMDENGVLFYGLLADNSIARWDSKTPFSSGQMVIARDRNYIQWPDSIAFDMSGNLLVITNRLQKFIYGQINLNEPNFRILGANFGAKSYLYGPSATVTSTENKDHGVVINSENNNASHYDTHTAQKDDNTTNSMQIDKGAANSLASGMFFLSTFLAVLLSIFNIF